jgi:hypothetical protein
MSEHSQYVYRGYKISYNRKPIPTRAHDWDFWHDDIDVDDPRHGTGPSMEDCRRQIDEQILEASE